MSSALTANSFPNDQESRFFWIRPVDEEGQPVDPELAQVAYSKGEELRVYRRRELTDDAVRADLVERAVYTTSRIRRSTDIQEPAGYILTTFSRMVDRYIARANARLQTAESELLDRYHSGAPVLSRSVTPEDLDNAVLAEQIINAIPADEDRWCWKCRLLGYEVQEIASDLNVSPECLSMRMRRSAKKALARLNRRRRK